MKLPVGIAAILVALLITGVSLSQDDVKPVKKTAAKIVNRLPNNYGKIGIDESQRKRIYAIQATFRTKKQALLRELEDLRTQQNMEIQNVLTEEQKTKLKSLLDASQKKREASRAKRKK